MCQVLLQALYTDYTQPFQTMCVIYSYCLYFIVRKLRHKEVNNLVLELPQEQSQEANLSRLVSEPLLCPLTIVNYDCQASLPVKGFSSYEIVRI